LLLSRAIWYLSPNHSRLSARRLGFMELILGAAVVATAAIGWHL
jgi:hypothetical protein